ncbi:LacI family DNA-binding transcriptional regulator [Rathayibacter sp. CAU 1779]
MQRSGPFVPTLSDDSHTPTLSVAVHRQPDVFGIDPFYNDFVNGVEDRLRSVRGSAVLRMVDSVDEELEDYRRWASDHRIDGVVIVDFVPDDPRVALVKELGLPAVLLGGDPSVGLTTIDVDNARAMNDAIAYLTGLGHHRIGRVAGPEDLLHTLARTEAFAGALASHDAVGQTVYGDYSAHSGAVATRTLLSSAEPPTAIVYDNAQTAVAGLAEAAALGVSVPGDLSILAWDDNADCQLCDPPLSVMDRDVRALGHAAASALLDVIADRARRVVKTPAAVVVERGSTASPPR